MTSVSGGSQKGSDSWKEKHFHSVITVYMKCISPVLFNALQRLNETVYTCTIQAPWLIFWAKQSFLPPSPPLSMGVIIRKQAGFYPDKFTMWIMWISTHWYQPFQSWRGKSRRYTLVTTGIVCVSSYSSYWSFIRLCRSRNLLRSHRYMLPLLRSDTWTQTYNLNNTLWKIYIDRHLAWLQFESSNWQGIQKVSSK